MGIDHSQLITANRCDINANSIRTVLGLTVFNRLSRSVAKSALRRLARERLLSGCHSSQSISEASARAVLFSGVTIYLIAS